MKKIAGKNTKYSTNETILQIGHFAKAIAFAKLSVWVQNSNSKKTCRNPFNKHSKVVLWTKPLEKTSTIPERDNFENAHFAKDDSLCKIVRLGQKLTFALQNDQFSKLSHFSNLSWFFGRFLHRTTLNDL